MSDTNSFELAQSQSFDHSETIGKLAEALSKASGVFEMAVKDKENPAYKGSKYTPLENLIDATRPALAANGLAVLQLPKLVSQNVRVTTILAHSSGEWISSDLELPGTMRERFDAQSVGSGITYARRYAYQSILNIAGEVDDDGNAAAGVGSKDAAQALVPAKVADYKEKAKSSVSDKNVRIAPGKRGDESVVWFEAGAALAVVLEEGLKDVTQYDEARKQRFMKYTEDAIAILDAICVRLGFTLKFVDSPAAPVVAKPEAEVIPSARASGQILKSVSDIQKGKKAQFFSVEYDGKKAACFHIDWHPFLRDAVGKPCVLELTQSGQYWNLVGVVSTNGVPWHEGAPSLQQELR